jgi:magnesium transporter
MIQTLLRDSSGAVRAGLPIAEVQQAIRRGEGPAWVDFDAEPDDVCEPILRDGFGFHPLAVDDALRESHVPKVDDWEQYLYLVLHDVALESDARAELSTIELDVFLGPNYIVTHHDQPITALTHVWERCQRDDRHLKHGADHLFYALIDEVVAGHMTVFEDLDERLDAVEANIFGDPTPRTLEAVFRLKRAMLHLRRILGPQREVLNKLARDDFAVIDPRERIYFRDVYDHLVRLYDINESLRDQAAGSLEIYLSVVNNRLNEVLKTLTLIATMFLPATFIAGFFGMNIFMAARPVDIGPSTIFPALAVGLMLLIPGAIYLWGRRRGWL